MKHLQINQNFAGLPDFLSGNLNEPLLLTNLNGNQFLVLPANKLSWQELFLRLSTLPDTFFVQTNTLEQKRKNVAIICGAMKGKLSSSEEFARNKQKEKEREERKFKR